MQKYSVQFFKIDIVKEKYTRMVKQIIINKIWQKIDLSIWSMVDGGNIIYLFIAFDLL